MMLTTVVFCADQASAIQSAATVDADGGCQVTMIATIHLDYGNPNLTFPLLYLRFVRRGEDRR